MFYLKNKVTGTCLSLGRFLNDNAQVVVSRACNKSVDQRWQLHSNGSMMSKGSPLFCLDVAGSRPTTDASLLVYPCEDLTVNYNDQIWRFESNNESAVLIKNVHTEKCATLSSPNNASDGVEIFQSTCDSSPVSDDWWEKLIIRPGE